MKQDNAARAMVDRDTQVLIHEGGGLRCIALGDPWPGLSARQVARDWDLHQFDLRNQDRDYWRSVCRFLEWLGVGMGDWPKRAYKRLRRLHHELKKKDWDDVLPVEIRRWANTELAKAMDGLDCVDNARVALVGNTGQVRRYNRQRESGCCGSSDFQATGPDGNRYMLGFNFGH